MAVTDNIMSKDSSSKEPRLILVGGPLVTAYLSGSYHGPPPPTLTCVPKEPMDMDGLERPRIEKIRDRK